MLDNTLRDTPTPSKRDPKSLDAFTRAYIECALWSSTYETEEREDTPMDANFSVEDLAPECIAKIVADCAKFQHDQIEAIAWDNLVHFPHRYSTHEKAGHDFWLTRNGHGAGFWDGDWKEPYATSLTDAAHAYGSSDFYVGDDGMLYCA